MDVRRVLLALALGEVTFDQLPGIAREMIEAGLESPSLRTLATLRWPVDSGALRQLETALAELGLAVPTQDEALLERAKEIAAEITEGSINPFEGAYRIWQLRRDRGGPELLEPLAVIVQEDLAEVDALLRGEAASSADQLRAHRSEIDRRYEGLILSEARSLASAGSACVGVEAGYD